MELHGQVVVIVFLLLMYLAFLIIMDYGLLVHSVVVILQTQLQNLLMELRGQVIVLFFGDLDINQHMEMGYGL